MAEPSVDPDALVPVNPEAPHRDVVIDPRDYPSMTWAMLERLAVGGDQGATAELGRRSRA